MTEKRFYLIGQRPQEVTFNPKGDEALSRHRLPFTRRHLLKWRSRLNPKTLRQERVLADKRPLWWALSLIALAGSAPLLSNSSLTIAAIFCMFAAINVLWTLVIGTAGIFSLATLAIVGIGGYVAAGLNVYLGLPWPLMFVAGLRGWWWAGFWPCPRRVSTVFITPC
jgi:branched-chain amino acid transport system permease protein